MSRLPLSTMPRRYRLHSYLKTGLVSCLLFGTALLTSAQSTVYDANDLTVSASSGDNANTSSNAGANNGNMVIYMADAVTDYVTFEATIPAANTYNVAVRYHRNPNRGTVQLAVDGTDQGAAQDLYDAVGVFEEFDLGNVALTSGTTTFKFTVTGHNASSSNYRIAIDTITLTPAAVSPPAAPTSLATSSITSNSVAMTWNDNSTDEDAFTLQRKLGAGGSYSSIATLSPNTTAHTDSGLSASSTYMYRLSASNAGGSSAYSNELFATTTAGGGGSPVVFDANELTVSASSGDNTITNSNAGANNGNMLIYMADAVSDYVTFEATIPAADTYTVAVRYHLNPNRGTVQLAVNGTDQGAPEDLYDASGAFGNFNLGSVALSAGTTAFKFTVTGHNASSSNYRIAIDTITLTPASGPPPARTDITTFATITDALNSGVPLYAPPGTYTMPADYTPIADIDILGDLDPAQRPVFNVQRPALLPADFSLRFQGIHFVGVNDVNKLDPYRLLGIASEPFNIPNFIVLDCSFYQCSPIVWGIPQSITGQVIQRMEFRRFSITEAQRGLFAGGRVDDYDITDFTIDNCGRVGIGIGPSGTGINETITSLMQRGYIANGVITGTYHDSGNNFQLGLSGHNVTVEDVDLFNMAIPSEYDGSDNYPPDSEPFYTKVEDLTVNNLYIENDGANQAMWSNKGASLYTKSPISPKGGDVTATNLTFVNTGIRYCVGIWHQAHGDNIYKNVTFHNRTKDAIIIHKNSASGTVTVENWTDVFTAPNTAPTLGIKNKSLDNDTDPGAPAPVTVIMVGDNDIEEYAP